MSRSSFISQNGINALPLILIIEDDDDTRVMMRYLLNLWGYQVLEAVDGEEGLQMAEDLQPEIILMDYSLPKIDGLTATKRIREMAKHDKTSIIFISAFSEATVRVSALASGANDFLLKPIDFGELEESLNTHFENNYRQETTLFGGAL